MIQRVIRASPPLRIHRRRRKGYTYYRSSPRLRHEQNTRRLLCVNELIRCRGQSSTQSHSEYRNTTRTGCRSHVEKSFRPRRRWHNSGTIDISAQHKNDALSFFCLSSLFFGAAQQQQSRQEGQLLHRRRLHEASASKRGYYNLY